MSEPTQLGLDRLKKPKTRLVWTDQLGPDRLKKSKTGSVWIGRLGPNRLKKPGAGSNGDGSARLDQHDPEGHLKDIPMREYILELV